MMIQVPAKRPDKPSMGRWCAYCASFPTHEERKRCLEEEVPEELRGDVLGHMKTIQAIRNRARQ